MTALSSRTALNASAGDIPHQPTSKRPNRAHSAQSMRINGGARQVVKPLASVVTIVIVEPRTLIRDCLVQCVKRADESYDVLGFATVAQCMMLAADGPSPTVIVLCTQSGHEAEAARDLGQLTHGRWPVPVIVLCDAEHADHIVANIGLRSTRLYLDQHVTRTHYEGSAARRSRRHFRASSCDLPS